VQIVIHTFYIQLSFLQAALIQSDFCDLSLICNNRVELYDEKPFDN